MYIHASLGVIVMYGIGRAVLSFYCPQFTLGSTHVSLPLILTVFVSSAENMIMNILQGLPKQYFFFIKQKNIISELPQHFTLILTRLFCNYLCLLPLRDSEHLHHEVHSSHLPQLCEFRKQATHTGKLFLKCKDMAYCYVF